MTHAALVTDTHPLLWYMSANYSKLSSRARQAFDGAVEGLVAIWVPAAVLWEISLLIKAGRVRTVPLEDYLQNHFYARAIHALDLLPEDVVRSHHLAFSPDPWDTMIVAVALRMECPLITKDEVIHRHRPCQVYWD